MLALIPGCSGNGDDGVTRGRETETRQGTDVAEARRGGNVTYLSAGDVDYLDPGQTYYTFGYLVHYAVNRTLYSFTPDDSINAVPDLAEDRPQISRDNRTITVKLRSGVRYSPPVNREVRSDDIKYAFERAFSAHVPNGYATAYFSSIVGTPSRPGEVKAISGITTPDASTLVFKLKEPAAPLVAQALVMPITTPVPREYARRHDAKSPSTYNRHVTFTGPYMVPNDRSGRLVGWSPGKSMDLVRNPNWDGSTDYRPAYLDEIRIREGNSDLSVAARRALSGESMLCCDTPLPAPEIKRALDQRKDQIHFAPGGGTYYISLNTTVKPLDNLNVRKAILAVSDRNALRLSQGGAAVGDIAGGWLPPGIPGFDEAGGLKQNLDLDFLRNPAGDPTLAKKYMLAAKRQDPNLSIDADGRWTDAQKFLTIAANADPAKKAAEVFQGQIEKLGFKLNLRLVPPDTILPNFVGRPAADVAFAPNVAWFKDFADPQAMLDATFNGNNILRQGNSNWPELDVPAINRAMTVAGAIAAGRARNKAWARINHMIAEQAPAIPWLWPKIANVHSGNVAGVVNGYYTTHDLNFTSLE
jgi:peptide/nickel transport system substrate-binding protein